MPLCVQKKSAKGYDRDVLNGLYAVLHGLFSTADCLE